MPTPEHTDTLDQPTVDLAAAIAWPGNTYSLTYEQAVQRAATALQVLAPLGFVDGNEEGESPGEVYLSSSKTGSTPGVYCFGFHFNVSRYATLADALVALMPAMADHFREQGREEIRVGARKLFGAAPLRQAGED